MSRRTSSDKHQLSIRFPATPQEVAERVEDARSPSRASVPPTRTPRRSRNRNVPAIIGGGVLPTVDRKVIDAYMNDRGNLRTNTLLAYQADLHAFAREIAPHGILTATPGDLRAWIHGTMRDPGDPSDSRRLSPRSMTRKLASLAGFYRWARRRGMIVVDPTEQIARIDFAVPAHPAIREATIERFFGYLEQQIARDADPPETDQFVLDLAIFRLCYQQGLRVSEAIGLRMSNIRSVAGEIQIDAEVKGGHVRRYPITGQVLVAWRRWMEVRRGITAMPGTEDMVFLHPHSGRRISRRRVSGRIKTFSRNAGLDPELLEHFTTHSLRHAHAQDLDRRGLDLRDIRDTLGHSRVDDSLHYLRALPRPSRRLEILREVSEEKPQDPHTHPEEQT